MTQQPRAQRHRAAITALLIQVNDLEGQWPAQRLHDLRRALCTADQMLTRVLKHREERGAAGLG